MPTIAQTMKEKRLISELFSEDDARLKKQRVRFDDHVEVLTEDDDEEEELDDTTEEDVEFVLSIGEDGDFDYTIITATAKASASAVASTSNQSSQQDIKKKPSFPQPNQDTNVKITRPASPFAGSDRRLCEELYIPPASSSEDGGDCCPCCEGILNMMTLPSSTLNISNYYPSPRSSITSWQSSLGNNLKIFIPSSSSDEEDDDAVAGAKSSLVNVALLTPTPLITPPLSPRKELDCSDGVMPTGETIICEWPCNLTVDNAITSALELRL